MATPPKKIPVEKDIPQNIPAQKLDTQINSKIRNIELKKSLSPCCRQKSEYPQLLGIYVTDWGEILPKPTYFSWAHCIVLLFSPFYCSDMIEILLKGT